MGSTNDSFSTKKKVSKRSDTRAVRRAYERSRVLNRKPQRSTNVNLTTITSCDFVHQHTLSNTYSTIRFLGTQLRLPISSVRDLIKTPFPITNCDAALLESIILHLENHK